MAQKLTFQELKDILDYLSERQPDSYSSLLLYVNEINEKGTIFKTRLDDDSKKLLLDSIVIQQTTQLISAEQVYKLPVVRNSDWADSGHTTSSAVNVRDRGLAGYANIEEVLDTICKAFGVTLAEDMKLAHPDIYDDLVGRVARYYEITQAEQDLSKTPYMAAKVDNDYRTLIPLFIIYEIGRVLDNYGIFEADEVNYQPVVQFDKYWDNVPLFNSSQVRTKIISKLEELHPTWTKLQEGYTLASELVDFNNIIIGGCSSTNLVIMEIPKHVKFEYTNGGFKFRTPWSKASDYDYVYGIYAISDEDFSYTSIKVNLNATPMTYTKSVKNVLKDKLTYLEPNGAVQGSTLFNNINFEAQPIFYMYNYYTGPELNSTNKPYFTLGNFPGYISVSNSWYGEFENTNFEEVSLLNGNEFRQITALANSEIEKLFNNYNIELTNRDFLFGITRHKSSASIDTKYTKFYIIRNAKTLSFKNDTTQRGYELNMRSTFDNSFLVGKSKNETSSSSQIRDTINLNIAIAEGYLRKLSSDTPFDYEVYELQLDGTMYRETHTGVTEFYPECDSTLTTSNFYNYYFNNTGKLVIPKGSVDWATLETGANYPTGISTVQDFKNKYSDWYSNHISTNNPYVSVNIETDEETVEGLAEFDYIPLSMSGASNQAIAQAGIIGEFNFDIIIKDIEDAEDDANNDETKNKPSKNVGNTPDIPGLGDLVSVIGNGGMNQYYLNATQLGDIFESLFSLTPTAVVQNLFGNPLDFIVSLQLTYLNPVTGNAEPVKVGPYALKTDDVEHVPHPVSALPVSEEYISIDCGSVDLSPYFDTYLDYTATSVQLFLPFCGFVSVDFSEFIKGKMHIKAIADTLTGLIVYFIICEKDGTTQTLYQFNGNCQQQIPLTGANMGRFMGDVLKGVASYAMSDSPIPSLNLPQINVSRSGSMEANIGIMTQKTPYIIIKRNAEYNANKLETLTGFPSNNYVKLANCTGYQKIKSVHTSSINATQEEKDMIESILKSGVIV